VISGLATPDVAALAASAEAHVRAGRLLEAQAAYQAALALAPDNLGVTLNLGVIAAMCGDCHGAITRFDAVIAREPHSVVAQYNRALALLSLGQHRDAIEGFSRVCALQPEHYEAHRAVGFLWLAEGNRGRALDHFARTYELRRGDDRSNLAGKSLTHATRDKLLYDAEQFYFLAKRARNGQSFIVRARTYEDVARDFPDGLEELSEQQIGRLGDDYNRPINLRAAAEVVGRAVSERHDRDAILHGFRTNASGGAVFFDELLTPEALDRLQSFLLESTIWHDFSHIGGFVASYLEDGLACPLILQIADEIRSAFPEVLGDHPLSQAWAFKGLTPASAIDVHADDGVVSVNFWVTPAKANLKPGSGGMVVSLVPPPPDWAMSDYAEDRERIGTFLAQSPHDRLKVPYQENRAVLFRSRLFHWSDAPDFAAEYENHRINLTFLYGRYSRSPAR